MKPHSDLLPSEVSGLPAELSYIADAIERSRDMLSWEDDWDGEGSPGYAQSTWDRAVDFILRNAVEHYYAIGARIEAPSVLPGPNGSIDIQWRHERRRLLINVPVDLEAPITFCGDDRGQNTIEGTADDVARNVGILVWLTE